MSDVWKAHYFRFYVEHWKPFGSLKDAISFLDEGMGSGDLSSVGVVLPDGTERKTPTARGKSQAIPED